MTQLKLAIAAVLFAIGLFCGWYPTRDHYLRIIAEKQIEQDKAVQAKLIKNQQDAAAHADKLKNAEEQHAKDQLAINTLSHQLARVHIHIPTGGCAVPGSAEACADDPDGGSGVFSARVDAAFAELQGGVSQLIQRCDQINIDARQANAAATR